MIMKNSDSLRCLNCLQEVVSSNRHDLSSCWCQDVYIDGGREYTRVGYGDRAVYSHFVADWEVINGIKIRVSDRLYETFHYGRLATDKDKRRVLDALLNEMPRR